MIDIKVRLKIFALSICILASRPFALAVDAVPPLLPSQSMKNLKITVLRPDHRYSSSAEDAPCAFKENGFSLIYRSERRKYFAFERVYADSSMRSRVFSSRNVLLSTTKSGIFSLKKDLIYWRPGTTDLSPLLLLGQNISYSRFKKLVTEVSDSSCPSKKTAYLYRIFQSLLPFSWAADTVNTGQTPRDAVHAPPRVRQEVETMLNGEVWRDSFSGCIYDNVAEIVDGVRREGSLGYIWNRYQANIGKPFEDLVYWLAGKARSIEFSEGSFNPEVFSRLHSFRFDVFKERLQPLVRESINVAAEKVDGFFSLPVSERSKIICQIGFPAGTAVQAVRAQLQGASALVHLNGLMDNENKLQKISRSHQLSSDQRDAVRHITAQEGVGDDARAVIEDVANRAPTAAATTPLRESLVSRGNYQFSKLTDQEKERVLRRAEICLQSTGVAP